MSKPINFLSSVILRNFKAIRNTNLLKFTPLTALIGNNGSGKSSLIEALETFHSYVTHDLDYAFQEWHGFEHVRNKSVAEQIRFSKKTAKQQSSKRMVFKLSGTVIKKHFNITSIINERGKGNTLFTEQEEARIGNLIARRNDNRMDIQGDDEQLSSESLDEAQSLISQVKDLGDYILKWQFLSLWPTPMGQPRPQKLTLGRVALNKDGSNIAQYLWEIRSQDINAFNGIIETLKYVLPYASDVQPNITSELERTVYLQLTERNFKLPGWLLSSGTLRILALLAVLRHPTPPPLILIEEIENGLDPRTIHLIVDEIYSAIQAGRSQIILTTHSPYLLDLLPLSSIVVCERENGGEPVFFRPVDDAEMTAWSKKFGSGQLYTMSRLSRRNN